MNWLFLLFAFVAGGLLAVQAGVNGQLGSRLGQPMLATLASFAIGTLVLILYVVAARTPWPEVRTMTRYPWWIWTGGLLGIVYVLATVILAQRLGAAVFISLVVAGQMVVSLLLDHYGLIGFPERPITANRLLGAALLGVGVVLMRR
jgi:transporter family-2 protein